MFVFGLVFFCTKLNAQLYYLNNGFSDQQIITTCSGTFYDAGINGNYSSNENYSVTFSPGNVNKVIQFNFKEIYIALGDTLFIYDGKSKQNNIIDTFTNVSINYEQSISPSDTNSTGSLTFQFKSDANFNNLGWVATIACAHPCMQPISSTINTNPTKNADGYTNFCIDKGGVVNFNANTVYSNNNLIYNQHDSSSYFHWFFGDGKDTIAKALTNVSHTFKQQGGFYVKLVIKDSNGCVNRLPIVTKIRTGIKPNFNITANSRMCALDTVYLSPNYLASTNTGGFVSPQPGSFLTLPVSSDSLFLPDGTGVTYTSNIFINQFATGQTLNNINDLRGIILNMEHSYLGDLKISITAPNGVSVDLKRYPGAFGCYLGEPVDEDSPQVPLSQQALLAGISGKGYDYIFNNSPTYSTMTAESAKHNYTFIDNAGRVQTNKNYLPAGSYKPEGNLSTLLGTPLNGTWTIQIKDHLSIDNGFLFSWKLDFAPSLFPNVETYSLPIISQNWVIPATGLIAVNGTKATVVPPAPGNYLYQYKVIDDYGCSFDTTIKIETIALPNKPNLGNDVVLCDGISQISLSVSNPDNTALYSWSNNVTGISTTVNSIGTYYVTAKNSYACLSKDTIQVINQQPIILDLGRDTMFCASNHNLLKPFASANVESYVWNDGSTKDTLRIHQAGKYFVTVKSNEGCYKKDSISITENPINFYTMPADTTICLNANYLATLTLPLGASVIWNDDGYTGYSKRLFPNNIYTTSANYVGCIKKDTMQIFSKPLPSINLGNDLILCIGQNELLKLSYPNTTYLWNNNSTDSFYLVSREGLYWVEATLNKCSFRDSIYVKYKKCECNTFIPNVFSPNGDGVNDIFKPKMDCVPTKYLLSIFNRYGQKVFETEDYKKGWDGNFNFQPVYNGTYYYILTYTNEGLQKNEQFSGSITILR